METVKAVRIGTALSEADLVIIGASNGLDMASAAYCRGSSLRMQTCDADGSSGSIKRSMSSMSPARS